MENTLTRELYVQYRNDGNRDEILRGYFNAVTDYDVDYGQFMLIYYQVMDDYPGLEEDISTIYPDIVKYFDKAFNLVFLTQKTKRVVTPAIPAVEEEVDQLINIY